MTFVREEENGNNGHHAGGRIDSGSRAGQVDSPRASWERGNPLGGCMPTEGADFGIRPLRRKAQPDRQKPRLARSGLPGDLIAANR